MADLSLLRGHFERLDPARRPSASRSSPKLRPNDAPILSDFCGVVRRFIYFTIRDRHDNVSQTAE
jgi:hypothetical protein